MKPQSHPSSLRSSEGLRSLVPSLATVLLLLTCCSTFAGGIVTDCTEASLRAALSGGGTVSFACDGTIVLSNTLVIASNTVLDATGRSITLDGNSSNRVFTVMTNVTCAITNVRVLNGWDASAGGGIHNSGTLTLQNCAVANNKVGIPSFFAGKGAGILNLGVCNLYGCILVSNITFGTGEGGGAIYNDNGSILRAVGSTFYNNRGGPAGGAIFNNPLGRVGATNCTFVGNISYVASDIFHQPADRGTIKIELLHCTFGSTGQRIVVNSIGYFNIWVGNSIVPDCVGCLFAGVNITNSSINPRLAPLADNGGPTPTMALLPESPAINTANNALAPAFDQRGVARPFGATSDIGAYEATVPPAPVVIEFEQANSFVSEGAATATLNVVRRGNAGPTVTVNYATQAGAALAGFDYVATNGTLTFGFGQTNATILVPIINDTVPEPEEVFTVSLSNATGGAALGAASIHQVHVQDNDPVQRGAFRFQFGSYRVSESGSPIVVNVLRVGGTNGPVAVDFATGGPGTAQPGSDFVATNGTLSFGDTESIKTFTVQLLPDAINEGAESFSIALSNPAGGATLTNPAVTSVTLNDGVQTLLACDEPSLRAAVSVGGKVVLTCDGVIPLTSPLIVSNGVVIDATGHDVTLSGRGSNRIFQVNSGVALELLHLTLADGLVTGTNGSPGQPGGVGAGGAVWLDGGILTAKDCAFIRNQALGGTGGITASFGISGQGGEGRGGAIYSVAGLVSADYCSFSNNKASGGTAGLGFGQANGGAASGGALYAEGGFVRMTSTRFETNQALGGRGLRSGGAGWGGVAQGGALEVNDCNVDLQSCVIQGNVSQAGFLVISRGGGIDQAGGKLSLHTSVVIGNVAKGGDGLAIGTPTGIDGAPASGGGINLVGGSLAITNSTLASNAALGGRAPTQGAPPGSGSGGGIYSAGDVAVVNCTFSANSAVSGATISANATHNSAYGGGFYNAGGQAEFIHVSMSGNAAIRSGSPAVQRGGAVFSAVGITRVANTLIANSPSGSNAFGALIDGGGNMSSDGSCNFTAPGSLNNTAPILGPLADYGGPTPTMALLAGSPAIDAGLPANCLATDQRGVARPFGAACDIGAFESAAPYTVLGRITGYVPPFGSATVSSGLQSAVADAAGEYALHGFAPGTHALYPASSNCVFLPKIRMVNIVADTLGIDFHSYRTNALVIERQGAGHVRNTFAGEPFAAYSVEVSTALSNWTYHGAITTDVEGLATWTETNAPAPAVRFFRARRP